MFHVGMLLGTRNWYSGGEPHYGIKKSITVFWSSCGSDKASCLKICVGRIFSGWEVKDGGEGGVITEGWSFLFLYHDSRRQCNTKLST